MTPPVRGDDRPPSWFDPAVFNPLVAALSRLGLSFAGSRILDPVFRIEPACERHATG
jgi:hypothetical protein